MTTGVLVVPIDEMTFTLCKHTCSHFCNCWRSLDSPDIANTFNIAMATMPFMMTSANGNFPASLALCDGNLPATGRFPSQRPVTWSFDVLFPVRLNKMLSKTRYAGDLRRHGAHCDVTVILFSECPTAEMRCQMVITTCRIVHKSE